MHGVCHLKKGFGHSKGNTQAFSPHLGSHPAHLCVQGVSSLPTTHVPLALHEEGLGPSLC